MAKPADPDSRARTHLANERTFLAWLRTGLSLVALGVGAAQFLERDLIPGFPLTTIFSVLLVVSGGGLVVLGAIRNAEAAAEIERGDFQPTHGAMLAATAVAILSSILALIFVILLKVRG